MSAEVEYSRAIVHNYRRESRDSYAHEIRSALSTYGSAQLIDTVNHWQEKLASLTAQGYEVVYLDVLIEEVQRWLDERYPLVNNKR